MRIIDNTTADTEDIALLYGEGSEDDGQDYYGNAWYEEGLLVKLDVFPKFDLLLRSNLIDSIFRTVGVCEWILKERAKPPIEYTPIKISMNQEPVRHRVPILMFSLLGKQGDHHG